MFAIVGLGNPGETYARHRHNVGFRLLDALAETYSFPAFSKKGKLHLSDGKINSHRCVLLAPQTYMNLSGTAVAPFLNLHKIPLSHCLVGYDDLDLPLGKIRHKINGGAGGHNGLRSLDQTVGSAYGRLRIGIDRPPYKEMVSSYVLNNFTFDEEKKLSLVLEIIAKHIPLILEGNSPLFMTRFAEEMRGKDGI